MPDEVDRIPFDKVVLNVCKMEAGAKKALNIAQASEVTKCFCEIMNDYMSLDPIDGEQRVLDFIRRYGQPQ